MKYNRVRCDTCKIDIHRATYARHFKSKKHLQNISQNKIINPKKSPIKRVVQEDIRASDTKVEKQINFTDGILKIVFGIIIDTHHDKHENSTSPITSKFNDIGDDINHIDKIMIEMFKMYAKLINQKKFKDQLTFFSKV